jgi:hypothetical protein
VVSDFRGLKMVQHSGGDAGYRSQITMFPEEKFSVIVLSNLATANPGRLAMQVAGVYLEDRFRKPEEKHPDPPQHPKTKYEPMAAEGLQDFAGDYYSDELGTTYSLVVRDGDLVATHRRHEDVLLRRVSGDDFTGNQWFFRNVHFTRGDGQVKGLMLSSGRVRNLRFVRRALPRIK